MKHLILLIQMFVLLLAGVCFAPAAQAAITIKGRVASATDDTPLAGATVRLLLLPDSTLMVGNYSDKDGNFTLASSRLQHSSRKEQVKVVVMATYMGYQTTLKQLTLRPRVNEYDLKDVYMQEDTRLLGEAIVAATAPPVVIKEDTIEYFADSYKTQPDATVEDLFKRLPGVEVNQDGSITAQGEEVQQIYVDGKEFFGRNMQATTKNLTADMVETVQVVDMQTEEARLTGIDDGERRKVINLKLKPKMRRGWFGNAAGAWGDGEDIDDRFETRGTVGFFRGNSQNALTFNANNTNNAGFGDMGNQVMGGSAMRGNRQSGNRGDGLNTSWSVGLNLGYDKGNRMRDPNTPLGINGNVSYGGSNQDEYSRTHTINYLKSGNTVNDRYNTGNNKSQNVQTGIRFEKSWGDIISGQHRLQINPDFGFNHTQTEDYSESRTRRSEGGIGDDEDDGKHYISQTKRRNEIDQKGFNFNAGATYSFTKKTDFGRRRSSVTLNFSERVNEGDQYTRSYTTYDSLRYEFDHFADVQMNTNPLVRDTLINQWQQEDSHNETYRIRITHVEPIADRQTIEVSAAANLSDRYSTQLYYFWNQELGQWADSINGRSNIDYSSDTHSRNVNYTLSAQYRKTTDMYNLAVGMDFLPQSQQYTDNYDHTRDYKRHYVNYAPRVEYRYNWSRRKNLRITLNGSTAQPSMNQLQARKNQTSATHVSLGNKDLDPSFSGNFTARYRSFNDETYNTIEASLSARATWNALATKRWYSDDLRTDTTMTVNLAGLGSWNVSGSFRGSFPFYDNLWYVTTQTNFSYSESEGYASIKSTDAQLNQTHTYGGGQNAGIAYRGEKLNIELRGNYNIQYTEATIVTSRNLGATHRFGVSSHLTAYLPWDITLSSDFSYSARRGYTAGLTRNQCIWNAQISRTFLKKKNLSAFVKVFDILHQRTNISRSVSATSMVDRETSILGQYFLVGASMRFNRMGARGGRGGNGSGGPRGGGYGNREGQDFNRGGGNIGGGQDFNQNGNDNGFGGGDRF